MPEEVSLKSIVVATRDQVSADLAGETAILHLKSGIYYGLNTAGSEIWKLLARPVTALEIRDVLLDKFEVGEDQCERDLLELLRNMAAEELIEVNDEPAS